MKVVISKADFDRIVAHARSCLPEEACGLVAGSEAEGVRRIEKVYLLENADHSNEHFSLPPQAQFAAIKDQRANGLRSLGNWHSHPETPSRPSEEDIRLAHDPRASYLILSLADAGNPVLKAFSIVGGVAREDELLVK
ncbi:MAG: M67 family metallopeptidase [Lentisphaerae bacterium]|nr:M67 family metallopeptidase [Lentisphaerota bacterium]